MPRCTRHGAAMNLTLTFPVLLTIVGMAVGLIWAISRNSLMFGRYIGELQTTVKELAEGQKRGDEMVVSLRIDRHIAKVKIKNLEEGLDAAQDDIGELMHRRRGDQ